MHMYVLVRSFSCNEHVYFNQDQHQIYEGRSVGSLHLLPASAQCIHEFSCDVTAGMVVRGLTA